jgi:aspartate racemase
MTSGRKVVGVLGGMGPEATVDFMTKVIALTPADKDQDHIRMIIDHNPTIPSRQDAILADGEDPGPELAAMARRLEAAGADFLVIPCNTAYAFREDVIEAVNIPLVSIIDETIAALPDGCGAVGLLATEGCLRAGVYQAAISRQGVEGVEPTPVELRELMQRVYAIKAGDTGKAVSASLCKLANALVDRGAEAVIVGCTEIPLVLGSADIDVPLLSSTDILAERTVNLALSE